MVAVFQLSYGMFVKQEDRISCGGVRLVRAGGNETKSIYIDPLHPPSNIIFIIFLPALAFAVKCIEANSIRILSCRHSNCCARRFVILQKFPKFLFSNVDGLVAGSVGHLHHRPE